MKQVFSHSDSATVGLLNDYLNDSGIETLLKNWTGSNITSVPIPDLFPSIYVLDPREADAATRMIEEYLNQEPSNDPDWTCPSCQNPVDGFLSECWSCQSPKPAETGE